MKFNFTINKKEEIANGTTAFYFEKPEGFEFRAGQFADFVINEPETTDDEGNIRAFSIIEAPYENMLGFATRMRDTAFKNNLKNGTYKDLTFEGAYGDFTLHKNTEKPAVFIIGGIGITPVFSIIKQSLQENPDRDLVVVFGNKTPEDAPFEKDLQELSKKYPRLSLVSVYSDKEIEGEKSGYINFDIIKELDIDLERSVYYLAGPETMVKAMRKMLVENNVDEDSIKTEEFSGY